jgi:hypothetical protein
MPHPMRNPSRRLAARGKTGAAAKLAFAAASLYMLRAWGGEREAKS